jgi:hypothetical protein
MICCSCRYAGNIVSLDAAEDGTGVSEEKVAELHGKCPGRTWCDCQHQAPARPPGGLK